jgi:YD repeat-containing protein
LAYVIQGFSLVGRYPVMCDAVGNRTSMTDDYDQVGYTYNAANQMVEADGGRN